MTGVLIVAVVQSYSGAVIFIEPMAVMLVPPSAVAVIWKKLSASVDVDVKRSVKPAARLSVKTKSRSVSSIVITLALIGHWSLLDSKAVARMKGVRPKLDGRETTRLAGLVTTVEPKPQIVLIVIGSVF